MAIKKRKRTVNVVWTASIDAKYGDIGMTLKFLKLINIDKGSNVVRVCTYSNDLQSYVSLNANFSMTFLVECPWELSLSSLTLGELSGI